MSRIDVVNSVLNHFRPSLAADGFDLHLLELNPDGPVRIVLEAKAGACLDCLVPERLIAEMIEAEMQKQDPSLGRIQLVKKGFDEGTGHGGADV